MQCIIKMALHNELFLSIWTFAHDWSIRLYIKKNSINLDDIIAMEWYIIPENLDMSF